MKKLIVLAAVLAAFCGCAQQEKKECAAECAGEANPVVENIMARRSIRKYKPQRVERDVLMKIMECGINAPNGQARESWEVRVVDSPELIAGIDSLYRAATGRDGHALFGAPAVAFIAYDTEYDLSQVDCGLLGENMILAAQSMGLGTCCLGGLCRFVNSEAGAPVLERLGLPDTHRLLYAIVFGYPDESPAAKERNMGNVRFVE